MCCSPICWLPPRCAKTRRCDCVASTLVCILEPSAGKHIVLTIPLAAIKGDHHETRACRAPHAAELIGNGAAIAARNSVRLGCEPPEAAAGYASRRGGGCRRQFQGAHLRLFARRLEPGAGIWQHGFANSR